MLFDVVVINWIEDYPSYRGYKELKETMYTGLSESEAHAIAEDLVGMWVHQENGLVKRFINGRDHGAYVEDALKRKAYGIRVTVLPQA